MIVKCADISIILIYCILSGNAKNVVKVIRLVMSGNTGYKRAFIAIILKKVDFIWYDAT